MQELWQETKEDQNHLAGGVLCETHTNITFADIPPVIRLKIYAKISNVEALRADLVEIIQIRHRVRVKPDKVHVTSIPTVDLSTPFVRTDRTKKGKVVKSIYTASFEFGIRVLGRPDITEVTLPISVG
ncbi:MAG: hypothetical protein AAB573_04155 [Patescibacteria group bacterium]